MGQEEAVDSNFRERFLALQRLEMADAGYICERRSTDPDSPGRPDARRAGRSNCRTREAGKTVDDADTLGASA